MQRTTEGDQMKKLTTTQHRKLTTAQLHYIRNTIETRERMRAEIKEMTNAKLAERCGVHVNTIDRLSVGVGG